MILIDNLETPKVSWEHAIRGMRNPLNSWKNSDSHFDYWADFKEEAPGVTYFDGIMKAPTGLGSNDKNLATILAKSGPSHAKYRRMLVVYCDITAPLYWWKEFDTYKVGTVANSCSTMHKITAKQFELRDFSTDQIFDCTEVVFEDVIRHLNKMRKLYLQEEDPEIKKGYWWQIIQLLPSSYNQKRTVMMNYEVLANIYKDRKSHKLDEWRMFCKIMKEELPYSELFTMEEPESKL